MRKDVRIGLSIGGVLLAVLIVYLLVPKDSNTGRSNTQTVAQKGATGAGGTDSSGATGQAGTGSGTDTTGQQPSHNNTGTPPDSSPGQSGPDANRYATGNGNGSGASGAGLNGTGATGTGTGVDAGTQTPGASGQNGQAEANSNVDWATILNRGVMPESMMATRDPFAEDTKRGHGTSPETTSRNTPGAPIDWTDPGSIAGNPGPTGGNTGSSGSSAGGTTGGGVPNTLHNPGNVTGMTSAGIKEHTVQRGETFSTIALAVYGDAKYWTEIKKANPNVDDRHLKIGTVIKLPDAAAAKAAHAPVAGAGQPGTPSLAGAKVEAAIDPSREYRVQPNDSLQKIALKLYGKASKWEAIHELNKDKIGPDEHKIKVGMVLKLPEAPTNSPTATR